MLPFLGVAMGFATVQQFPAEHEKAQRFSRRYPLIQRLLSGRVDGRKPLVIFDTETTGLLQDPSVTIVELAAIRLNSDNSVETFHVLLNPGLPIPEGAVNVHGIRDEDVADSPSFPQVHGEIRSFMDGAIIGGFNSEGYDVPLLDKDCRSADLPSIVQPEQLRLDVRRVWGKITGSQKGKLTEIADVYGVLRQNAHRAFEDVMMTFDVLEGMILDHGQVAIGRSIWAEPEAWAENSRIRQSAPEKLSHYVKPKTNPRNMLGGSTRRSSSETKDRVTRAVLEHLERRPHLPRQQYADIASVAGATAAEANRAIGEMLDEGIIGTEQVIDPEQQAVLHKYFPEVEEVVGDAKTYLRSLRSAFHNNASAKEELARIGVDEACYVQLRILRKTASHDTNPGSAGDSNSMPSGKKSPDAGTAQPLLAVGRRELAESPGP